MTRVSDNPPGWLWPIVVTLVGFLLVAFVMTYTSHESDRQVAVDARFENHATAIRRLIEAAGDQQAALVAQKGVVITHAGQIVDGCRKFTTAGKVFAGQFEKLGEGIPWTDQKCPDLIAHVEWHLEGVDALLAEAGRLIDGDHVQTVELAGGSWRSGPLAWMLPGR